jgi:hypothetical protein
MARDISSGFQTAVGSKALVMDDLIKIEFDSGDLRLWSGVGEITYDGEVYTGAGGLIGISSLGENGTLAAEGATFTLSGVDTSIIALALQEDYQGKRVTGTIIILDDNGTITASHTAFVGKLDVMALSNDGESASISVTAESDAIRLQRVSERRFTDADHKKDYPDDTGLSYVTLIQDIELDWGAGL